MGSSLSKDRWNAVCGESRMHGVGSGKTWRLILNILNQIVTYEHTIFSHHANTPKDLVLTLRNSLVNDGGFSNMETAEKQVTDVVKVDIHLDYTADGKRYIDRISEIVQLDEGVPYPDYDLNDPDNSMNKITAEYYRRQTDRVGFTTRLIMHYDLDTHTYVCDDRFSEYLENRLRGNLDEELRVMYDEFMLRNWGPRHDDESIIISRDSVETQLENLEEKLEAINNKYKDNEENERIRQEKMDRLKAIDDTNLDETDINNLWKSGYAALSPDEEEPEFSLGSFFEDDDDLYS